MVIPTETEAASHPPPPPPPQPTPSFANTVTDDVPPPPLGVVGVFKDGRTSSGVGKNRLTFCAFSQIEFVTGTKKGAIPSSAATATTSSTASTTATGKRPPRAGGRHF